MTRQSSSLLLAGLLCVSVLTTSYGADIIIDIVRFGDPGNVADRGYGHGAVGYNYSIGKYEVANAQWIEFLNAVAKTADPYHLYASAETRGIDRSGTAGNYSYGPRNGDSVWLNLPVTYVSFWDACRFANWLHNGQPTGEQGPSTTENGAYTLNGYYGQEGQAISRNADARWAVPTLDEWYKAAFYKGGTTDAGYWRFPTQSDSPPAASAPPGATEPPGAANCHYNGDWRYSYLTSVGAYIGSPGPYGTFDQGGNVTELTETLYSSTDERRAKCNTSYRGDPWSTQATAIFGEYPGYGFNDSGFRVVFLPEPASALLLAGGGIALLRRCRRRS